MILRLIQKGQRVEQAARIEALRLPQPVGVTHFDDAAGIHDQYPVKEIRCNS